MNNNKVSCIHKWNPYKGPIPAIATSEPAHHYKCEFCRDMLITRFIIPSEICNHDWKTEDIGFRYAARYCTKCKKQICDILNLE